MRTGARIQPETDIRDAAKQLFERKFLPAADKPKAAERIDAEVDDKITRNGRPSRPVP